MYLQVATTTIPSVLVFDSHLKTPPYWENLGQEGRNALKLNFCFSFQEPERQACPFLLFFKSVLFASEHCLPVNRKCMEKVNLSELEPA